MWTYYIRTQVLGKQWNKWIFKGSWKTECCGETSYHLENSTRPKSSQSQICTFLYTVSNVQDCTNRTNNIRCVSKVPHFTKLQCAAPSINSNLEDMQVSHILAYHLACELELKHITSQFPCNNIYILQGFILNRNTFNHPRFVIMKQ